MKTMICVAWEWHLRGDWTKWYWMKWYGQNGTDKMSRTKWYQFL